MVNDSSSATPTAKEALQHYLDDLMMPQTLTEPTEPTECNAALSFESTQMYKKISQVEQLFLKANATANLPTVPSDIVLETSIVLPSQDNLPFADLTNNKDNNCNDANKGQTRDLSISLKDSLPTRFQVLLCEIANMAIAIPLTELGGIHSIDKLSKMGIQSPWCRGILIRGQDKFICIDVAKCLSLEKEDLALRSYDYKYALQLGKTSYALCCDSVSTTIDVHKDDITWRETISTRPWLSGLIKQNLCALVDGTQMLQEVLKRR